MRWGKTVEERHRQQNAMFTPHKWFAWYPVYTKDGWMWLENISRVRYTNILYGPRVTDIPIIEYFWIYSKKEHH